MAHFWIKNSDETWAVVALEATRYALRADLEYAVSASQQGGHDGVEALTLPLRGGDDGAFALLGRDTQGTVAVNGAPLHTGMRVLRDRDEIRLHDGRRLFFSTECLTQIAPYPKDESAALCPRCKMEIRPGQRAVRCPNSQCGI